MSGTFEQARDFFLEGLAHYQAGRHARADQCFTASLALVPGRASTLTNLGAVRLKLGRPQEAEDLLAQALAQEPDNLEALGQRATALAELGRHAEALACVDRVLRLDAGQGQAWGLRGSLLKDLGRAGEAAASFDEAIARGAEPELHRYYRAALTGQEVPRAAPRDYVRTLFDNYAEGFERHLVDVLHYQAPEVLAGGLRTLQRRFDRALDLGCGTGLCGPLVRPLAQALDGVDISATMVERCAATGVYDEVLQADLVPYLAQTSRRYDLVLAADVFIYVGALEDVFAGVARAMTPGGVFCFSVEAAAGDDLVLRPSLRYAHSRAYIGRLAQHHGFDVATVREQPIREDQRAPIPGDFFWLTRR